MRERCPLCGGTSASAFAVADLNLAVDRHTFLYRRCTRCGTRFLADVPDDLGRWYPEAYFTFPAVAELDAMGAAPWERYKLDAVLPHVRRGRLVEIGPGFGVFARAAAVAGFEVCGLEMDARCCAHLRDVVGVGAVRTDDPAAALAALPPSAAVAMWHSLEHMPDPGAVLAAAALNLVPGGVLAIGVPNPAALQFRLVGRRWAHVDAPRHLQLAPAAALIARARAEGLEPASLASDDAGARHWNAFGWGRTLIRPRGSYVRTRLADALGTALAAVARPFERLPGRGSAYTLVLRKPR